MKLLHIPTEIIIELPSANLPPYAVLSHTWNNPTPASEFPNVIKWATDHRLNKRLILLPKIIEACRIATVQGIEYLWVDWLCIDLSSTASIEQGVNEAFNILKKSSLCIVYLNDLKSQCYDGEDCKAPDQDAWSRCQYWNRAWTLQELIIPTNVQFFDGSWKFCGSKRCMETLKVIRNITGISEHILVDPDALWDISLASRMSWMSQRTCRREEDIAYALAALCGVSMQVRYGEGSERAFLRLQEEILLNTCDGSILAWRSVDNNQPRGLLAQSPVEFAHFSRLDRENAKPWLFQGAITFNNRGVQIQSNAHIDGDVTTLNIGQDPSGKTIGVYIAECNGMQVRVVSGLDTTISKPTTTTTLSIPRYLNDSATRNIRTNSHYIQIETNILQHNSPTIASQHMYISHEASQVVPLPIRSPSRHKQHKSTSSSYLSFEQTGSPKRSRSGRCKSSKDIMFPVKCDSSDDEPIYIDCPLKQEVDTDCEWDIESESDTLNSTYNQKKRRTLGSNH